LQEKQSVCKVKSVSEEATHIILAITFLASAEGTK